MSNKLKNRELFILLCCAAAIVVVSSFDTQIVLFFEKVISNG